MNNRVHQGHLARKRFGQNFLTDQFIIDSIVDAIHPQPGQAIVEIGPGLGALSSHVYQVKPTPAKAATSSRRSPGVLRLVVRGRPTSSGEILSRFCFKNSASSGRIRCIAFIAYCL